VGHADEDDVPMLWQTAPTMIASAVATLAEERKRSWRWRDFVSPSLSQLVNSPSIDSRTPDIIDCAEPGATYGRDSEDL